MNESASSLPRAILGSGFIVGLLDATSAMVHAYALRGTTPNRIWKYVASGAFGPAANTGGPEMIVAGLLFHFFIATCWTGLFFILAEKVPTLREHKVIAGALYGIFIWLAMNFVIVPMSRIGPFPVRLTLPTILQIMIHLFIIGVPISLLANRYYAKGK
ncbi:MAG: hypothetical protein ABIR28_03555 [Vicinamibacteria bacterium]